MKLEEIEKEWSKDCDIHLDDLANDSAKIHKLHAKYSKIYVREKLALEQKCADHKKLTKAKIEYYTGRLSEEELKTLGWEPFPLRLLKQDIDMYLDADQDIIDDNMNIAFQNEKVKFLESILRTLNNRGFVIKNCIDFLRWSGGA